MNDSTDRFRWLKWIDRFNIALAVIAGLAAVALMVNVVFDVAGRFLLNKPIPPTLDFTQYAWMPTLIALGLGLALQRGEHIRVSLLTSPTSSRVQRIVEIVAMVFTLATLAPLTYFTAIKAYDAMNLQEAAVGSPWMVIWPFRWIVTLGLIGLFLQAIAELVRAATVETFISNDDDVDALIEQEQSLTHTLGSDEDQIFDEDQPSARATEVSAR